MSIRRLVSEAFRRKAFYAVCLAAAMVVLCFGAASAQEEIDDSYVDLSLHFEVTQHRNYLVVAKNEGDADALGVRAYVVLTNQERGTKFGVGVPTVNPYGRGTSYSSIQSNGQGDLEGWWEIGTLEAGGSRNLALVTTLDDTRDPGATYMMSKSTVTISSQPSEAAELLRDNVAVGWRIEGQASLEGPSLGNKGGVMVSVDDLNPGLEDSVKFTLAAVNLNGGGTPRSRNSIVDVEVKVRLTPGLEFATGWTPNPSQGTFMKEDSRSGTWDVGDILSPVSTGSPGNYRTLEIQARLTAVSLEDIPLEERCFSASVSDMLPPPDPDYVMGRLKACLGDDPPVLFESGGLDLFTVHPCVGVSTSTPPYPCRNENNDNSIDSGLELVATAPLEDHPALRARGVGRFDSGQATSSPKVVLRPGNVVIQPSWRGSDLEWLADMNAPYSDYKQFQFSVADVTPGGKPGSFAIRFTNNNNLFLDIDNQSTFPANPVDLPSGIYALRIEFGAIGTYNVQFTANAQDRASSKSHSATETYVFHVGPIAELGVRDGGTSMEVPADQQAFTIVAVNNGPDDAPAAQVTVTGLSQDDVLSHSATAGIFDPATGVWTIGELKTREYVRAANGRDGEVLTITPNSPADRSIDASIRNTLDYSVMIGTTTATTTYYDYDDRNDSATIPVHSGTGAALPSDARAGGTQGVSISWDAMPSLFGRAVSHYQVERSASPWVMIADNVLGTSYTDTNVASGRSYQYRVRAVNDLDHKGPWSPPIRGSAPAPVVRTVVRTVTVAEDPFAYFPSGRVSRSVVENSAPGSPVGAPVVVVKNSGNDVVYSLEGADAAQFAIEPDSGQILVGQGTVLDFESDRTSYSVKVVAAPSLSSAVRATVDIDVVDVAEPATEPEVRIVTVVRTETVTVPEDPFAYFGSGKMSRSVAENSLPGSPVGAPVTVIRNSGNNVHYSLKGADAALFRIEQDSGQILVGEWTVLDFESDRTSYSVEVVADPSRGSRVRTTVDIDVTDVAESASVSIGPAGQPRVGEALTATLTHGGGEPVDPRWQWYRSTAGGPWAAIQGASQARYTPTERDAGARLRVIATYGEPDGDGQGVAGAVTPALAGEPATTPVARSDANGDGRIDLSETLAAIAAYFRGELDHDAVMEVIGAYYAG